MKNLNFKRFIVLPLLLTTFLSCDKTNEEIPENKPAIIFMDDFEQKDLENWKILGRQQGSEIAEVILKNGSNQAHLNHKNFTEITLERVFAYSPDLLFEFDMDAEVYSEASNTSDFYSLAAVRFYFINNDENGELGWVQYSMASSSFHSKFYQSDPKRSVNEISTQGPVQYTFSVSELIEQIQITHSVDSIKLMFFTYGSGWPYNLEADLWIDNIVITDQ